MKPIFYLLALVCSQVLAIEPSSPMLNIPGTGGDPDKIDYASLPLLHGTHAVVCPYSEQWKFQLHNYLSTGTRRCFTP